MKSKGVRNFKKMHLGFLFFLVDFPWTNQLTLIRHTSTYIFGVTLDSVRLLEPVTLMSIERYWALYSHRKVGTFSCTENKTFFLFWKGPPQPPFPKKEKGFVFGAAESANLPVWLSNDSELYSGCHSSDKHMTNIHLLKRAHERNGRNLVGFGGWKNFLPTQTWRCAGLQKFILPLLHLS